MGIGRQLVAGLMVGSAFVGSAYAQTTQPSPKIIISNANTQIPLDPAASVQFNAAGDMTVTCKLTNGSCPGLGQGGSTAPNAPTVTLTPSATAITTAQSLTLNWTSTGAETCYSSAPSGITGWTLTSRGTSGSQTISGLAAGSYQFSLRCYNTAGSTTAQTASITVTQVETPPPAADYCQELYGANLPTHPSFTAHGFTRVDETLTGVWGIAPGAATTTKKLVPGNYMVSARNSYLAIEFTMTDDSGGANSQFGLGWIDGGTLGVAGAIHVSISPCPGDFRAPVAGSSDPYLNAQCKMTGATNNGQRYISSVGTLSGCPAPKNKKMYINVATYQGMSGDTTPSVFTCGSSNNCGGAMLVN